MFDSSLPPSTSLTLLSSTNTRCFLSHQFIFFFFSFFSSSFIFLFFSIFSSFFSFYHFFLLFLFSIYPFFSFFFLFLIFFLLFPLSFLFPFFFNIFLHISILIPFPPHPSSILSSFTHFLLFPSPGEFKSDNYQTDQQVCVRVCFHYSLSSPSLPPYTFQSTLHKISILLIHHTLNLSPIVPLTPSLIFQF